jgi:hypothetical protein
MSPRDSGLGVRKEENKMAVEATRLTVMKQIARSRANRDKPLAIKVVDPRTGRTMRASEVFALSPEKRAGIPAANIEICTPLGMPAPFFLIASDPWEIDTTLSLIDAIVKMPSMPSGIITPEMIGHPALPFEVMKGVIVNGPSPEACIPWNEVNPFGSDIATVAEEKDRVGMSLRTLRQHAARLNRVIPGGGFRVPTREEFLRFKALLGDQLEGRQYWNWTETVAEKAVNCGPPTYELLHLENDRWVHDFPGYCNYDWEPEYIYAGRLVRDINRAGGEADVLGFKII